MVEIQRKTRQEVTQEFDGKMIEMKKKKNATQFQEQMIQMME